MCFTSPTIFGKLFIKTCAGCFNLSKINFKSIHVDTVSDIAAIGTYVYTKNIET